jgi:hypothetical protein
MRKIISSLFLVGACVSGDVKSRTERPPKRIDRVERVFMHRSHEYSLLVRDASGKSLQTQHFFLSAPPAIIDDVPENHAMWAELHVVELVRDAGCGISSRPREDARLEIHVHSVRDLKGAGWKVEHDGDIWEGATQVIE